MLFLSGSDEGRGGEETEAGGGRETCRGRKEEGGEETEEGGVCVGVCVFLS